MLSVAEVFELQPGDATNATWINPGFRAVVISVTQKKTKAGKDFFPCVLGSEEGGVTVECSFFTRPKFSEGAVIELSGQGLRRTEYNGNAQVAIGQKTDVHVISSGGQQAQQRPSTPTAQLPPAHSTPQDTDTTSPAPGAGDGEPKWINGQTVGMAMKEAISLAGMCCANGVSRAALADPLFWQDVKMYAGNIIRISSSLEKGKLSPPSWPVAKREAEPVKPAPTPPPKQAAPPPRKEVNLDEDPDLDRDVPF